MRRQEVSKFRERSAFTSLASKSRAKQPKGRPKPRPLARGAIAKACERLLRGSSCSIATAAAAFSSSRHFVLQLRLDDPLAVANGTTSFVADVVATMALQ